MTYEASLYVNREKETFVLGRDKVSVTDEIIANLRNYLHNGESFEIKIKQTNTQEGVASLLSELEEKS